MKKYWNMGTKPVQYWPEDKVLTLDYKEIDYIDYISLRIDYPDAENLSIFEYIDDETKMFCDGLYEGYRESIRLLQHIGNKFS